MSRTKPQLESINQKLEQPIAAPGRSAFDIKAANRRLNQLTAAELKQLRIISAGTRLAQNEDYLDLNNIERGPFTCRFEMAVGPDDWVVAKKEVPHELWQKLLNNTKSDAPLQVKRHAAR